MGQKWRWRFMHYKGLRYELVIAFGLIIMVTIVFLGYLFPGASPYFALKSNLRYVIGIALLIIALTFMWLRQVMINPLIRISSEAKKIAQGDYTRKIETTREDEIGELGAALNKMTSRIKENMLELKAFSEKTEAINTEINKRIFSLSSLLQISNLISQNADFAEIIEVGLNRCISAGKMSVGCLILKDLQANEFMMKALRGPRAQTLVDTGMSDYKVNLTGSLLGKAILKQETIVVEKSATVDTEIKNFRQQFFVHNALIVPIVSRNKVHGLLVVGNDIENYTFPESDKELLDLLSKQIGIAIENALLESQVERLEVTDNLTGLYNNAYIRGRLDEEIKRAISFQRPCAFVILAVDNFNDYQDVFGHIAAENVLIRAGATLKENITPVDKAARFGDHEFALILPERNKRQAIEIADDIRRKIELLFFDEPDKRKKLSCTGAVTENPVDGITADELIKKGCEILESAKKQGGNRICHKI